MTVVATGCAGVLAIAGYVAAASTIKSFLDDLNPDEPAYTLSGYVYIDQGADRIAVQADATLPSGGDWEVYANAPLSLDTSPPRSTTSNAQGFFRFTGIPQGETTHILTIGTPSGGQVQFTVRLDKPSITPLPSG
jgi:hypothetical protein